MPIILDEQTKATLALIHNILAELEISAYIIGGQARNFWFMDQAPSPRLTRDIDWILKDKEKLAALKARLIEKESFLEINYHKLISPYRVQIDLTSFQDSISQDDHFLGLHEVFQKGIEDFSFEEKVYKIATIPALILLKLIAFSQRPEHRAKDIEDIAYMLAHYDTYTEDGFPLYAENINPDYISARMIGRKIKEIIADSPHLVILLKEMLEKEVQNPIKSKIAQMMVKGTEKPESEAINQLKQLLLGLSE